MACRESHQKRENRKNKRPEDSNGSFGTFDFKGRRSIVADQFPRLFNIRQALVAEVGVVKRCVVSVLREQVIVIALLDDPSLVHHDDAVSRLHG